MSDALLEGSTIPTRALAGATASAYLDRLGRAVRAARLNSFYPDARHLISHLRAMSPDIHRGLYDDTRIDTRSGLPAYRDWTRVQTDVTIADDQLHQLGPLADLQQKAREKPGSVWERQAAKHDYYTQIRDTKLATLGDMDVSLRRIDRATGAASFHVVLDKLDVSGLFVRYTIDLDQTDSSRANQIHVDERDIAEQTDEFRGLLYKFTSLDAEFTFVKLATLGNLTPERVTKGLVGPVWSDVTDTPPALRPLVDNGGFVATFGFDIAAVDVAQQKNNDPFATLAQERLNAQELKSYEQARERFGYKVFKDRKFVVPRDRVDLMRKVCEDRGTKNIIYGI